MSRDQAGKNIRARPDNDFDGVIWKGLSFGREASRRSDECKTKSCSAKRVAQLLH
jgi:hypothetical protein